MAKQKASDVSATQFVLEVEGVDEQIDVIEFEGFETISDLFSFDIHFKSESIEMMPDQFIGKPATYLIHHGEKDRLMSGIISRFEARGVHDDVGLYNATLSPECYRLEQIFQSRIFQAMELKDIINQVFGDADLNTSYVDFVPTETMMVDYCVQYQESDLNFINRICQQHGLFYYFTFEDEETILHFANDAANLAAFDGDGVIKFLSPDGLSSANDHVTEFRVAETLLTSKFTARDYNFTTPQLDMTKFSIASVDNKLERYEYPVKATTQSEVQNHSKYRIESEDCRRYEGIGASDSIRIVPGHTIDLENHSVRALNASFLITGVSHQGTVPAMRQHAKGKPGYLNKFTHQTSDLPYRSEFNAYQPRINGSQTATVTGPSGHEIYSDEYGRVKVHFHWDRLNEPNENSSCWVRVAQAWAGKGWGGMFIPRIGQEVIVEFLEGDPDQPIIAGCVYNGENMPPYTLPDDQTKSTIRSESSLGGDGFNEFRFEDDAGSEEIYLHAQKDYNLETLNNKSESVGANETQKVKGNRSRTVGGNETVKVSGKRSHNVVKDEVINNGENRILTVGKDDTVSIGKKSSLTIGDSATTDIASDSSTKIGKSLTEDIGEDYSMKIGKDWSVDTGDKIMYNAGKLIMFESRKALTLKCGKASIVLNKNGQIMLKGKNLTIKGSGNITIKGSKITQN